MRTYDNCLLKDKADISEAVSKKLPSINVLGAYEKPNLDKDKIKVISVKFSKVGKKTFTDYKNLEWVVCRSHGIDNVNIEEAKKRNIGIVATSPTAKPCADWIYDKIQDQGGIVIFGNGSISRELQQKLSDYKLVDSKTPEIEIRKYLETCRTIIIAIPLNDSTKKYFDRTFFFNVKNKVDIISISRGEVFDNQALLDFSNTGKLLNGDFDMLSADGRDELLKKDNIKYYEHTSWEYNVTGGEFGDEYADNLKSVIDSCLDDNVRNAHLNKTKNIWF